MLRKGIIPLVGLLMATGASATQLNTGFIPLPGVNLQSCLAMGRNAIAAAGLRPLSPTPVGVWGEVPNSDLIFTVYCPNGAGGAIIVGAGPNDGPSESIFRRVLDAMNNRGGGGGGGGGGFTK